MLWFKPRRLVPDLGEPRLIEFHPQLRRLPIPIVYTWHDELTSGELGPQVEQNGSGNDHAPSSTPDLAPHAVSASLINQPRRSTGIDA